MKRRSAMPFLTLTPDCMKLTGWFQLGENGIREPVGDHLRDWEYGRGLTLSREIEINWDKVTQSLGYEGEVSLELITRAGTGQGRLARLEQFRHSQILGTEDTALNSQIELDGRALSDQIVLTTDLLFAEADSDGSTLSPRHRGDRLWSEQKIIRIEGDESRFPMEVVSFNRMFPNRFEAGALWYLHWSPSDYDRDFHGAIRLFLNGDFPDFVSRLQDQDEITLQLVLTDVVSQMCEYFLANLDSAEVEETYEAGSVGAQISSWLNLAFGPVGAAQMRSTLEFRPNHFRAALQSAMRL